MHASNNKIAVVSSQIVMTVLYSSSISSLVSSVGYTTCALRLLRVVVDYLNLCFDGEKSDVPVMNLTVLLYGGHHIKLLYNIFFEEVCSRSSEHTVKGSSGYLQVVIELIVVH